MQKMLILQKLVLQAIQQMSDLIILDQVHIA